MIITTARFGDLQIEANNIINLSPGLLAFEDLTRYILLDIAESPFFKWLQSLDNPELAFLLVDPFTVKKDYIVDINDELVEKLSISDAKDVLVYTMVNVPPSGFQAATTNLIGPLIINWPTRQGRQIIIDGENYTIKHPLVPKDYMKLSTGG